MGKLIRTLNHSEFEWLRVTEVVRHCIYIGIGLSASYLMVRRVPLGWGWVGGNDIPWYLVLNP